jgi:hypothetical protein
MASRFTHVLGVLVLASISTLAAACGGGGVKIDDLGGDLIDALCQREVRCGAFTSVEACKAGANFDIEEIKRSIAAGRTEYSEDQAADCIDALGGASCDSTAQNVRVQPEACRHAFEGTVADGGQCYNDEECLSEDCNIPSCNMACCAGTCSPTVTDVAIGGTCGSATGPCVVGSFCDSATTTCVALKAIGGTCTSNSQCGYNLYCLEAGTCAEAPNRGQACPDGFCADLGDRCDGTSMTCVALARQGEACQSGFAGLFDCIQPLTCNQTSLTCDNPPTAGQACLFFCADGNFCNANDQCEATKPNGTACTGDEECNSAFCDATAVCADEPICG